MYSLGPDASIGKRKFFWEMGQHHATYSLGIMWHRHKNGLIELPFGVVSGVGIVSRVLDGRAYWRHLANAVRRLWAAAEWVCHRGWQRGLFPNYFGQFCRY